MNKSPRKILVLDGISGVPLGREICDSITEYGIEVVYYDCLRQRQRPFYTLRSAYAKVKNRRIDHDGFILLPKLVEKEINGLVTLEMPSHILVIGFAYKFFLPKFLRRLANTHGAQLFLYDTDSCNLYSKRREFIHFVEEELPVYDRIFSFSQVTTRFFRDTRGLDAVHLPYGALQINMPKNCLQSEVLFVGSGDLRRIFLLEGIREHVTVRGTRWQRNLPLISPRLQARIVDKPIWGEALHGLLGGAKIVLNITRTDFYGTETGVNLRIFEALAAGCFLLTDHCDEVEALFRKGIEIETYSSASELNDKVQYYLGNDDARLRIARQGHQAFLDRHSWKIRISEMLALMSNAPSTEYLLHT